MYTYDLILIYMTFETDKITWTYKKDGEWHCIPKDINDKMEKAYGRNKHGSTILELDGHM